MQVINSQASDSKYNRLSQTEMKDHPKGGLSVKNMVEEGRGKAIAFDNGIHYEVSTSHLPYRNNRYQSKWDLEKKWRGTNIDVIFD